MAGIVPLVDIPHTHCLASRRVEYTSSILLKQSTISWRTEERRDGMEIDNYHGIVTTRGRGNDEKEISVCGSLA